MVKKEAVKKVAPRPTPAAKPNLSSNVPFTGGPVRPLDVAGAGGANQYMTNDQNQRMLNSGMGPASMYQSPAVPAQAPKPPSFSEQLGTMWKDTLKAIERLSPIGGGLGPSDPYKPVQTAIDNALPGGAGNDVLRSVTGGGSKVNPRMVQSADQGGATGAALKQAIDKLYQSTPMQRVMQSRPQGTAGKGGGKKK